MDKDELQQHVANTYKNLRWGLVSISFAFPILLWAIGYFWYNIPLQKSMSAYYFIESTGEGPLQRWIINRNDYITTNVLFFLAELDGDIPMRTWFSGILFVLGVLLVLYKGFSKWEDRLLNLAGLAALGVALFPMDWNCGDTCRKLTLHDVCAVVVFISIAAVAFFLSKETLNKLPPLTKERRAKKYRCFYNGIGVIMLFYPLIVSVITWMTNRQPQYIFFLESVGVWIFAAYWAIKSKELNENRAEILALEKSLDLSSEGIPKRSPTP